MNDAIKKIGVNFGIILSIVLILLTVVMYVTDIELFVNTWLGFLRMIIIVVVGVLATARSKGALQGFMTFKEAFIPYFITIVLGIVAYTLFVMLLFNVIDPDAKQTVLQLVLENTVKTLQQFGSDPKMIKETIKGLKETDSFGVMPQLIGLGVSIIGYSVIGLIVAVIFRNKRAES